MRIWRIRRPGHDVPEMAMRIGCPLIIFSGARAYAFFFRNRNRAAHRSPSAFLRNRFIYSRGRPVSQLICVFFLPRSCVPLLPYCCPQSAAGRLPLPGLPTTGFPICTSRTTRAPARPGRKLVMWISGNL